MIDKSITLKLGDRYNKLLTLMSETGIEFRDRKLLGPQAMTTYYCIYLDMDKMLKHKHDKISYIILHEIGHFKRITKVGKEQMIKSLSINTIDEFNEQVIGEEIFADRYSRLLYRWLYNEFLPINLTQQLENTINKSKYCAKIQKMFGIIDNSEEKYLKLVESFIIEPNTIKNV